jgi:hypothetical protein
MLFPSDVETFGNVTLEALASGCPCVVEEKCGGHLVQYGIYIYMCIYIYVYKLLFPLAFVSVFISAFILICMYACMYIFVYEYIHIDIHTYWYRCEWLHLSGR